MDLTGIILFAILFFIGGVLMRRYILILREMYLACRKVYFKHNVKYVTWEQRKARYRSI